MAIPVWTPGQILTSSDVNNWLAPSGVVKPSDQSVTSSTALVNDTALVIPVLASAQYTILCMLDYEGGTQGSSDIKVTWAFPASATMRWAPTSKDTTGAASVGASLDQTQTLIAGTNNATIHRSIIIQGSITTAATAGNLQLKWAQNSSSATATIVHAQSYLQVVRMS